MMHPHQQVEIRFVESHVLHIRKDVHQYIKYIKFYPAFENLHIRPRGKYSNPPTYKPPT